MVFRIIELHFKIHQFVYPIRNRWIDHLSQLSSQNQVFRFIFFIENYIQRYSIGIFYVSSFFDLPTNWSLISSRYFY